MNPEIVWLILIIFGTIVIVYKTFSNVATHLTMPAEGPYRTQPIEIKDQKPKQKVKMSLPKMELSRTSKAFISMVPVLSVPLVWGTIYDMPSLGVGFKVGCYFTLTFIALLFAGITVVHVDKASR